jgi:hypothetical protein
MVSDIPKIKNGIRAAILLGKTHCTDIARHIGESVENTFKILRLMITEGEVKTFRNGGLTVYELVDGSGPRLDATEENKEKVLISIRAGYRTYPQIQINLRVQKSVSIADLLERMETEGLIKKHVNAEICAFFEPRERPKDFWLDASTGKTQAIFEEEEDEETEEIEDIEEEEEIMATAEPAATTAAPPEKYSRKKIDVTPGEFADAASRFGVQQEIRAALKLTQSTFDARLRQPEFRAAYEEGKKNFKANNPGFKNKTGCTKPVVIDEDALESCAKEGLTQAEAAIALGVNPTTLSKQLKSKPNLKRAWGRGQKISQNEKYMKSIENKENGSEKPAEIFTPKLCASCGTEFVIESFLTTADGDFCNESCRKAFEKDKTPAAPFEKDLAEGKIVVAVQSLNEIEGVHEDGRRVHVLKHEARESEPSSPVETVPVAQGEPEKVETDQRFENTVRHISENGHSAQSIEKIKDSVRAGSGVELIPPPRQNGQSSQKIANAAADQVGYISLKSGGEIVVGFTGNFFAMTPQEREKLNKFAELIQE